MAVASHILQAMESSSAIRKAFEEGIKLRKQYGDDNVFDFSLGNPDLEPPKEVNLEMKKIVEADEKGSHAYMPNTGYAFARKAMANKVAQEQGVDVDENQIIMSSGAAGALNVVFKAILEPGDEVIVPSPFFAEYTHYCANHGGKLIPAMTNEDFSLNLETIKAALSEKTVAILINSPNNPTGKIYSKEDIASLAKVLNEHAEKGNRKPYIIADEPYREITYDNKKVAPLFPVYDASIVVSSFAKNLSLPGERIGYIAFNKNCPDFEMLFAACVFATRVLGYVNAPAFFQKVVANTWNAPVDYSSYLNRRNALTKILDDANIQYASPEGAFYLFCKVPESKNGSTDEKEFCEHLQKSCILGVPATGFGKKGWFRLAYCVSEKTIARSADAFKKARETW